MAKFSPRLVRSAPQTRRRWRVLIYNNHFHRFDDVVSWLMEHTGHDKEQIVEICAVCEEDGRAVCLLGSRVRCHEVASALRLHGLQVEVDDF